MGAYGGLLVCGEFIDGKVTTTTRELMNAARRLSDELKQPLNTVLIGKHLQEAAGEVIALGAQKVYLVNGPLFAESHPDLHVAIVTEVCQRIMPSIILLSHTEMGRDVAPRLAARLRTTVTVDCIDLAIDPETERLLQSKPVYGGNAIAVWVSESHVPQVVTLRPKVVTPAEPDTSRKGEIASLDITLDESMIRSKRTETVKEEVKGLKLEDAKVVVAGGGGIGGSDGFKILDELAKVLGGAIGASRVPCDEGWIPGNLLIGQTGQVLNPDLYVAVGISGSPQHMSGCSSSKYIIAINRDPDAHIFKEANFGVVGDYAEVIPPLIEKCKTLPK